MMALAGQVFNLTVQSTGQATALTEVMQELRVFEQTLREDLRSARPGNSLIVIQGNPVNAYWTAGGRDADGDATSSGEGPRTGYPHPADPEREDLAGHLVPPRADILMIFTGRRGSSFAEPGVSSNVQQVVYAHAELGQYVPSASPGGGFDFQPRKGAIDSATGKLDDPMFPTESASGADYASVTKIAHVPADEWHLARRSVLLLPADPPTPPNPVLTGFGDPRILRGEIDVVSSFPYEQMVLRPQIDPATGQPRFPPWFPPLVLGDVSKAPWLTVFARSLLDLTPPPVLASRLGHYMLPRCASFKVEWALNPRSEYVAGRLDGANEVFWFDPGWTGDATLEDSNDPCKKTDPPDPLCQLARKVRDLQKGSGLCAPNDPVCQDLDNLLNQKALHGDGGGAYSLSDRFRGAGSDPNVVWAPLAPDGQRPNLVVFTATRPSQLSAAGAEQEPINNDVFPGSLRVTVDVFDKDRRLDRPIRHVMVIPVGG